jgi:hypothetical protein
MANTGIKATELPTAANVAGTDRILIIRDPSGSPSLRTVNANILAANLVFSNSAPANSSANGLTGNIRYDSSYLYICVANNTWRRVAISNW